MPFFAEREYACRCGRPDCDAAPMSMATVLKLEGLRRELAQPMRLTSARRCKAHNAAVGGSPGSRHLLGQAVDVFCPSAVFAAALVRLAFRHGFAGIGIDTAKGFVHLDTRDGPPVLWTYPVKK